MTDIHVHEVLFEPSIEAKFRKWLQDNTIASNHQLTRLAIRMARIYREDPTLWRSVTMKALADEAGW